MVRLVGILAFLLVCAATQALLCPDRHHGCNQEELDAMAETNKLARRHGRRTMNFNREMYKRCRVHVDQMLRQGRLFHSKIGGGVFAENVARRSKHGTERGRKMVANQWYQSTGHRRNMLAGNACSVTCIRSYGGDLYGVQMFGRCTNIEPAATTTNQVSSECRTCQQRCNL